MDRSRPGKTQMPPALPQRSEKRVSRLLENVMVELKSLDGSMLAREAERSAELSDPLERYLSSEEDASLSDEYTDSESLVDFSPIEELDTQNKPSSRGSSRKSQEDTARVVSITIVGKPQIVEITLNPSSQKRQSLVFASDVEVPTLPRARRPSPLKLYPSALRRLSISSTMSFTSTSYIPPSHSNESSPSLTTLPPRKSSKLASNISSLVTNTKHAFLNSDPFSAAEANQGTLPTEPESHPTPPTPKTPISMAAAAWKHGMSRTLSKARKPSMPKISLAYTTGVVPQNPKGLGINLTPTDILHDQAEESDPWKLRQRAATTPQTPRDGPVRYQDILKNAVRVQTLPPQSPTTERKFSLGMRGLSRRKSIRGKDRYLG